MQILSNIPLYVWPLLLFIILGGIRARRRHTVPVALPLAIPTLFFLWSFISFFSRFGNDPLSPWLFALSITAGLITGIGHALRLPLHIDREKGCITFPGTLLPLILSFTIFTIKFSSGVLGGYYPHLKNTLPLLLLELAAAIPIGFFYGRGIGCIWRYHKSPNVPLENANQKGNTEQVE